MALMCNGDIATIAGGAALATDTDAPDQTNDTTASDTTTASEALCEDGAGTITPSLDIALVSNVYSVPIAAAPTGSSYNNLHVFEALERGQFEERFEPGRHSWDTMGCIAAYSTAAPDTLSEYAVGLSSFSGDITRIYDRYGASVAGAAPIATNSDIPTA
jgi:hypothetical protein